MMNIHHLEDVFPIENGDFLRSSLGFQGCKLGIIGKSTYELCQVPCTVYIIKINVYVYSNS